MAYRTYSTANGFTVDKLGNGDFTTIAAALTAAVSGDTIFLRPGTYTENPTLKAGVNLTAFGSDSSQNATGIVIISGTCTLSTAGTVTISGIQLQTNSAALLIVSGSVASIVNLENCYLNCTNNTGITFSSSSASAAINIYRCNGNLGTTGIAIFSITSAGALAFRQSFFSNLGSSVTANTISSGQLFCTHTIITNPITVSGTASFGTVFQSIFDCNILNTTALTVGGSITNSIVESYLASGTALAISISSTLNIYECTIASSNTNAITGAGTINYSGINFSGSSTTINTTTQTTAGTLQGSKNTPPTAGFLGEQIRATVPFGSAITVTTTLVAQNVTSISLTPGIWDVTGICAYNPPTTGSSCNCSISTTSATAGTPGDSNVQVPMNSVTSTATAVCPAFRITLTTTTTVFLVALATFSAGNPTVYGRISATRVG